MAEDGGALVFASELVPPEDWLLELVVSELPHPASTTAAARTRATIARMRRAKHAQALDIGGGHGSRDCDLLGDVFPLPFPSVEVSVTVKVPAH